MRKQECPIGFECVDGGYRCCNYLQCVDKAISWEIPYYTQDGTLIVRPYGWRYEWDDEAHRTYKRFCPLPSGSYKVVDGTDHEFEMKNRLRKAWLDAGWTAMSFKEMFGHFPPDDWAKSAIFGAQPTAKQKQTYQSYLKQLQQQKQKPDSWVYRYLVLEFGRQFVA